MFPISSMSIVLAIAWALTAAHAAENVPALDTGARGATMTFAQRGIGDVLIARETAVVSRACTVPLDTFRRL